MQKEQLDIKISINYVDTMKSDALHKADTIVFLPFLLSVLHYVVINCPDCESGRPTFESWYSQSSSRAEWKFNSDIGNEIKLMSVFVDLTIPQPELDIPAYNVRNTNPATESEPRPTKSDPLVTKPSC